MPALFLNLLKILFLLLLYLFLWQVARSIGAHLGSVGTPRRSRAAAELVVVRSDTLRGHHFALSGAGKVIGRSDAADIVIDDPYASDLHVRVMVQGEKVILQDLGSTNGTYVNGRRVTAQAELSRGDSIQIGKTVLEVR